LLAHPATEARASVAAASPSTVWQICRRRRRSSGRRSGRHQHEGGAGRKLHERDQAEIERAGLVSAYICQATATPSIWKPIAAQVRALQ
jgi:hypothetical protein